MPTVNDPNMMIYSIGLTIARLGTFGKEIEIDGTHWQYKRKVLSLGL
jgi:hypothetical protein